MRTEGKTIINEVCPNREIRSKNDGSDLFKQIYQNNHKMMPLSGEPQQIFPQRIEQRNIRTIALYYNKMRNGGIERVLALLSTGFAETENGSRFSVILITDEEQTDSDYDISPKVKRFVIPAFDPEKGKYRMRGEALRKILAEKQVDAVIYAAYMSPALPWDLFCVRTSEQQPAFFIHFHNVCSTLFRIPGDIKQLWLAYSLADGIITLSEIDKKFFNTINKNTRLIWNPCVQSDHPHKNKQKEVRHILWAGRITDVKRPEEMVRIMKYVVRSLPDAICHIVGDGDDRIFALLRKDIIKNRLTDNVILEGFHKDVSPFYREADVFVSTSEFEGFPMTFMESASYGIPTVTYDLPWLEYYRIISGWDSVDQLDAEKAAEVIVSLLTDPDKWESKSQQIYESFRNWQKHDVIADWIRLFEDYENQILPTVDPFTLKELALLFEQQVNFHSDALSFVEEIYQSASWKVGNRLIRPLHKLKSLKNKLFR